MDASDAAHMPSRGYYKDTVVTAAFCRIQQEKIKEARTCVCSDFILGFLYIFNISYVRL